MSRRLPVDARRAQLLELGLELFSTRPYDDVSIDEIADRAGISKGLLYHYFGGKRAFYVATVQMASERLLVALTPVAGMPAGERAIAGLDAYLDFVEARAPAFLALLRGGLGADREVWAIVDHTRQAIADFALDAMGLTDPSPSQRLMARAWIGAVEAASLHWLEHREPDRASLVALLARAGLAMLP